MYPPINQPMVYLDQWVWIRFARAHQGRPAHPSDQAVLDAVRDAAANGVIFPLSATHYFETGRIRDPRQRHELVEVMAPISAMWTIRGGRELVRNEILTALHEAVGRPTFRPTRPRVLGHGAHWAFRGVEARLRVVDHAGRIVDGVDASWLRRTNQYAEAKFLAGPWDGEVPDLRAEGYVTPRELDDRPFSRLDWERDLAGRLMPLAPSRHELRVWLLARELIHEHSEVLEEALAEYRLTVNDIAGSADYSKMSRRRMVAFVERIPRLRIAAEMKVELFRNSHREWTWNMVHDIDFLSEAIPCCRVVVADRDAATLVRRTGADSRHGTLMISDLSELPSALDGLRPDAQTPNADPTGWDEVGPGLGFNLAFPSPISATNIPPGIRGLRVQLTDPDGTPTYARPYNYERAPG